MKMTSYEYEDHCSLYNGYCTECDSVTREGDTEPDADDYECPECGDNTCMGIEMALIAGHIVIE